jgi:hypothetical protein
MALEPDGRVVLAGQVSPNGTTYPMDVALCRFLPSAPQIGSLTANGSAGSATVASGSTVTLAASNITDANPGGDVADFTTGPGSVTVAHTADEVVSVDAIPADRMGLDIGPKTMAQLTDLLEKLTDARLALVDAREALAERDATIQGLKKNFEERGALVKGDGDYSYLLNSGGERAGLPICPKCEALHQRHVQTKQHIQIDAAKCPACDAEFKPVTCYVPASENGGLETTTVDQYRERERQRRAENNAKIARLNSERSWMA